MQCKVLFLDAAGTLIRLSEPLGISYSRIAQHYGMRIPPDLCEAAFRKTWKAMPEREPQSGPRAADDRGWWKQLVDTVFLDLRGMRALPDGFFDSLYSHFAKPEAWEAFPEVESTLVSLRQQKLRLGVLSNFDLRLIPILEGLGLAHHFEKIMVSSQIGADKPHPLIFHHALNLFQIQAKEALHVGDELGADIRGAENAGIRAVWVNRPEINLAQAIQAALEIQP